MHRNYPSDPGPAVARTRGVGISSLLSASFGGRPHLFGGRKTEVWIMNKDDLKGKADKIKGRVEEEAGKVKGMAERVAGAAREKIDEARHKLGEKHAHEKRADEKRAPEQPANETERPEDDEDPT
jgi:uncharacterized protein YjbJ (UPF0337 family)